MRVGRVKEDGGELKICCDVACGCGVVVVLSIGRILARQCLVVLSVIQLATSARNSNAAGTATIHQLHLSRGEMMVVVVVVVVSYLLISESSIYPTSFMYFESLLRLLAVISIFSLGPGPPSNYCKSGGVRNWKLQKTLCTGW